ncbi:hypothetical protein LINPERHAP1_LOCUS26205 [Linum perenne]
MNCFKHVNVLDKVHVSINNLLTYHEFLSMRNH